MVDKKLYQNFKEGLDIVLGSVLIPGKTPLISKKIRTGGVGVMGDFGRSVLEAMKRKKKTLQPPRIKGATPAMGAGAVLRGLLPLGAQITPRKHVDTYRKIEKLRKIIIPKIL